MEKLEQETFCCKFCNQNFKQKAGLYRHQNHRCPLRPDQNNNTNAVIISSDSNATISSEVHVKDCRTINALAKAVAKEIIKSASGTNTASVTNIQNQNNIQQNIQNQTNNVTIYVNEKVDFLEILTKKFGGDEEKAVKYLKEKISRNIAGDIELFCDIYLVGHKDKWPLILTDKKNKTFLIKNRETGGYITDAGGHMIHQKFKANYMDALLKITHREINKVVGQKVGSPEFENRRDYLLDVFDLGCMQNKLFDLTKLDPKTFINKLSIRINELEKDNSFND